MTEAITRRAAMLGAAATSGACSSPAAMPGRRQSRPSCASASPPSSPARPASSACRRSRRPRCCSRRLNKAGGIGGIPVKAIFVDEAPGTDHLVGEYRRLVQNEGVHIIFASISSGSCLACTPLSDEMKKTTLLWDCGTQRIFEEGPHPYAFRTQGYGTPEVLAPLLYLLKHKPDFRTLAVINQDYAWGRDSWELWKAGMDALKPGVRVVAEMFPRFGATDYSTEVTRLLAARPDVILSTSWGGDLVTLVRQAGERRLFESRNFSTKHSPRPNALTASRTADSNASATSSISRATLRPRPPPPNAALIAIGRPCSSANATTSSAFVDAGPWCRAPAGRRPSRRCGGP